MCIRDRVLLLAACSDKTIRLGVAGIGGVYQLFGEEYAARQAQNGGRKLEVRETAGSAARSGCVVAKSLNPLSNVYPLPYGHLLPPERVEIRVYHSFPQSLHFHLSLIHISRTE